MCNHYKIIFKFKQGFSAEKRSEDFRQCGVSWSVIILGQKLFCVSWVRREEVAYYSCEKMRPKTSTTIKTRTVYQIIVEWDEKREEISNKEEK